MREQNPVSVEAPGQIEAVCPPVRWPFWVLGLAAIGALSYLLGSFAPLAEFTLPPAALILFGLLAGALQGFALRQTFPPGSWWLLASALAGVVAAVVSILPTSLAKTAAGLLAGWAYAWAVYGAVYSMMLQRISPHRWWMLASLTGWASAGIVSGVVGWALDVFVINPTDPALSPLPATARTWSMAGLAVMGAVCGATGGAITGAALVVRSRLPALPRDGRAERPKATRLVLIAGTTCGLIAAVLCTYLAPLFLTLLSEGSLDSLDMAIYALTAIYATPVCIPTIALVSIPLGIGCGYVGLEIAWSGGRRDAKPWVWLGAAIGGVAGYLLGHLVAITIGYL